MTSRILRKRCPKCKFSTTCFVDHKLALTQENHPIYVKITHLICNRKNCDWRTREDYYEKVKSMGLKPYNKQEVIR